MYAETSSTHRTADVRPVCHFQSVHSILHLVCRMRTKQTLQTRSFRTATQHRGRKQHLFVQLLTMHEFINQSLDSCSHTPHTANKKTSEGPCGGEGEGVVYANIAPTLVNPSAEDWYSAWTLHVRYWQHLRRFAARQPHSRDSCRSIIWRPRGLQIYVHLVRCPWTAWRYCCVLWQC